MSNTTESLSKKVYALAIKRTGKHSGEKYNTLMFYSDRKYAEDYAANVLTPVEGTLLETECAIFECELYHCGNPLAFITNSDSCFGISNFTPTK